MRSVSRHRRVGLWKASLTLLSLVLPASGVLAQEEDPAVAPARPLWEAGAVALGGQQQAYPGSDTRLGRGLALPYAVYRGRFLRAGEGTVGVRAVKTPTAEFDIGFAGSFGSDSSEVAIRAGMPNLGTLVEFGPRLKLNLPRWSPATRLRLDLPLRAVFDASDSLRKRGTSFEPSLDLNWRVGATSSLAFRIGAIYGDRKLAAHFYSVDPEFENLAIDRPAFRARSGLIATRLGASAYTNLSRDVRLIGYWRWDSVSGAANEDSPLVRRTGGATGGISLAWVLFRSERTAEE